MALNHPCNPRCNTKIYVPKRTEEERRAARHVPGTSPGPAPPHRAPPDPIDHAIQVGTDSEPTSGNKPHGSRAIKLDKTCALPPISSIFVTARQVMGDQACHTIARNEHSCACCARNEGVQRHYHERSSPGSGAGAAEWILAVRSP
jgi:hypothetical protein